jgi:hypothetical protein
MTLTCKKKKHKSSCKIHGIGKDLVKIEESSCYFSGFTTKSI